jgi:hypothetical protein
MEEIGVQDLRPAMRKKWGCRHCDTLGHPSVRAAIQFNRSEFGAPCFENLVSN